MPDRVRTLFWLVGSSIQRPAGRYEAHLLLVIVDQAAGGSAVDINHSVAARRSGGIWFNRADLERSSRCRRAHRHGLGCALQVLVSSTSERMGGALSCEWRAHQLWARAQRGKRTLIIEPSPPPPAVAATSTVKAQRTTELAEWTSSARAASASAAERTLHASVCLRGAFAHAFCGACWLPDVCFRCLT